MQAPFRKTIRLCCIWPLPMQIVERSTYLPLTGSASTEKAQDSSGHTAEEIFANREDKHIALIEGFDRFCESLGLGSIARTFRRRGAVIRFDKWGTAEADNEGECWGVAASGMRTWVYEVGGFTKLKTSHGACTRPIPV